MATTTPDDGALPRLVLADHIKDWLLQRILDETYPPGSRIVETQVARELRTSQAPVREALRGLEALGVVEITPFRGARVRRPTRHELVEAYTVRSELEALGARLAMRQMTEADLRELIGYGAQMRAAAEAGDRHTVATADASFHGRIIELAGNRTLQQVWRSLEPYSRTYLTLIVPGADPLWTAHLHDPIFEALERRDTRAVVRALRRHFAEASSMLARGWRDEEASPHGQRATSSRQGADKPSRRQSAKAPPPEDADVADEQPAAPRRRRKEKVT
jgi:DNA-binding GntR family transcriptional regulator